MSIRRSENIWILEDCESDLFIYEEILGVRYKLRTCKDLSSLTESLRDPKLPQPDLVVADLRLPDGCFLDFLGDSACRDLIAFPFIVVSSLEDIDVIRLCFDEGALDFLLKPFSKMELLAKVERHLALTKVSEPEAPELSAVLVDPTFLRVSSGDSWQSLTPKELQIVAMLQSAPDRMLSRSDIVAKVWSGVKVGAKTFDVHIFNLRRKLRQIGLQIRFLAPSSYALDELPESERVCASAESN